MNSTSTVNTSNLPNNIPKANNHLAISGSGAKVPDGPITLPRPGPTLAIAEAARYENEGFKDLHAFSQEAAVAAGQAAEDAKTTMSKQLVANQSLLEALLVPRGSGIPISFVAYTT